MKDLVCSRDTALELKQSGYPQPEIGVGQCWYFPSGTLFFINSMSSNNDGSFWYSNLINVTGSGSVFHDGSVIAGMVYAPTVTELLAATESELKCAPNMSLWQAYKHNGPNWFTRKSPCDALAALWKFYVKMDETVGIRCDMLVPPRNNWDDSVKAIQAAPIPPMPPQPQYSRVIPVQCKTTALVMVTKWEESSADGVFLQAWHVDAEGVVHEQCDVIEISAEHVLGFIRDYSQASANEFVNRFEF